jgi:hypothetical protein
MLRKAGDEVTSAAVGRDPQDFEQAHAHNLHILGLIRDEPGWALARILLCERLEQAVDHIIADSPGTPETVKGYLRKAKRGY